MRLAITRKISPALGNCELTHIGREAIDITVAEKQHEQYEKCLVDLGCRLHSLPAVPEFPDSVFVEDTAIVLDKIAVITRPGAESRRGETTSIARVLSQYRFVSVIQPPGTLDGGDVLCLGRRVFVGLSGRSNPAGIEQLKTLLKPHGYSVEGVPISGCLHFKSTITQVAHNHLLVNPAWVDKAIFTGFATIDVDPTESYGANALLIGETAIYPEAFPRTTEKLRRANITLKLVDVSELAKAEGAVTCCSLILNL